MIHLTSITTVFIRENRFWNRSLFHCLQFGVLTGVSEFPRLNVVAVGVASGAECAQPMAENGRRVAPGRAQSVAEVAQHVEQATTMVTSPRRAAEQLGLSISQRQPRTPPRETHRRNVAVHPTQRLVVACATGVSHFDGGRRSRGW